MLIFGLPLAAQLATPSSYCITSLTTTLPEIEQRKKKGQKCFHLFIELSTIQNKSKVKEKDLENTSNMRTF